MELKRMIAEAITGHASGGVSNKAIDRSSDEEFDEYTAQMSSEYNDRLKQQKTKYALCLVSHDWYKATIPSLYETPIVTSPENAKRFAKAVAPVRLGRPGEHGGHGPLVRCLNVGRCCEREERYGTNDRKNKTIASILESTKDTLRVFISAYAYLSNRSIRALTQCHELRLLDLTGTRVFRMEDMEGLARASTYLRTFHPPHLPAGARSDWTFVHWPQALETLRLPGGIAKDQFEKMVTEGRFPTKLKSLDIAQHTQYPGSDLLRPIGRELVTLDMRYIYHDAGDSDGFLQSLPALRFLDVFITFMERTVFDNHPPHPLEVLSLHNDDVDDAFGGARYLGVQPHDVIKALDAGVLPKLRSVVLPEEPMYIPTAWDSGQRHTTNLNRMLIAQGHAEGKRGGVLFENDGIDPEIDLMLGIHYDDEPILFGP